MFDKSAVQSGREDPATSCEHSSLPLCQMPLRCDRYFQHLKTSTLHVKDRAPHLLTSLHLIPFLPLIQLRRTRAESSQVERLRSELRSTKPKLPPEILAKLEELRAEAADIERRWADKGRRSKFCRHVT